MHNIKEISEAITSGDKERLQQIIIADPSVANEKTEQGISLLQFAAYCRNNSAVDIIRSYKKEIDIFEAASIADIDKVSELINENPQLINAYSTDGFTPLGLASFSGNTDIVKLLLSKGANPNIASNNLFKVAPIHSACAVSNYEITDMLIKGGADVNAKQMHGVTPLHSAAHNGQTKLAKLLTESGAEINTKTDTGQTPLFMAEEKGFTETAAFLKLSGGQ